MGGLALTVLALLALGCATPSTPRSGWKADLRDALGGTGKGSLQVREANGAIHVRGTLEGLEPGPYLLFVRRDGECGPAPAVIRQASLGPVGLEGDDRSLDEPLLLIVADRKGRARVDFSTSELRYLWGGGSILGKAFEVREAYGTGPAARTVARSLAAAESGAAACGVVAQ